MCEWEKPQLIVKDKPERNLGPGVMLNLEIFDYGLLKTLDSVAGRVDFELSCLHDALPLPQQYKTAALEELTDLFKSTREDFEQQIIADLPKIDDVQAQPRVYPFVVHSPYARQFIEVVLAADHVLTSIRAAWIAGQLSEETHQARARQVRGQIHRLASKVDKLFKASLIRKNDNNKSRISQSGGSSDYCY